MCTIANVEVDITGLVCTIGSAPCSDAVTCNAIHGDSQMYGDYRNRVVDGEWVEGYCNYCPTDQNGNRDPFGCYFDLEDGGGTWFI